jgi:hypothetical protein
VTLRSWSIAAFTIAVPILASNTHEIIFSCFPVWLVTQSSTFLRRRKHRQDRQRDRVPACSLVDVSHWFTRYQPRAWASAPVLPAIAFALIASSPMLIGFAITREPAP